MDDVEKDVTGRPAPRRQKIEHTSMIGRAVEFTGDHAWQGLPFNRVPTGERAVVENVYADDESPHGPIYTVRLDDGILVEVHSGHIRVI